MKSALTFIIVILSGCTLSVDGYIFDHTETEQTVTSNDYSISFLLEQGTDLEKSQASTDDLLLAQQIMNESAQKPLKGLLNVSVYIASSFDSWVDCNNSAYDSDALDWDNTLANYTRDTDINAFLITFNPNHWVSGNREYVVHTYIHELTHYVSYKEGAWGNHKHSNPKYWGPDGLMETVYAKWITLMSEQETL